MVGDGEHIHTQECLHPKPFGEIRREPTFRKWLFNLTADDYNIGSDSEEDIAARVVPQGQQPCELITVRLFSLKNREAICLAVVLERSELLTYAISIKQLKDCGIQYIT